MADQFDLLIPKNLLITLRSLRRRIDGVVGQVRSNPKLFALLDTVPPDGPSFAEILNTGTQRTVALSHGLARIAMTSGHLTRLDFEPDITAEPILLEDATDVISSAVEALADSLDKIGADRWAELVTIDDGSASEGQMSVLDLAREAARRGIGTLRSLQARLDQMNQGATQP